MLQCGTQRSDGSGLPPQSPSRWTHSTFPTTQKALPTSRKALGSAQVPSTNSSRSVQPDGSGLASEGDQREAELQALHACAAATLCAYRRRACPRPLCPSSLSSIPYDHQQKTHTLLFDAPLRPCCVGWWWVLWWVVTLAIARTVWHAPPCTARQHPGAHQRGVAASAW